MTLTRSQIIEDTVIGDGSYWAGPAVARPLFGPYANANGPKRAIRVEMGRKCTPSFQMLPTLTSQIIEDTVKPSWRARN